MYDCCWIDVGMCEGMGLVCGKSFCTCAYACLTHYEVVSVARGCAGCAPFYSPGAVSTWLCLLVFFELVSCPSFLDSGSGMPEHLGVLSWCLDSVWGFGWLCCWSPVGLGFSVLWPNLEHLLLLGHHFECGLKSVNSACSSVPEPERAQALLLELSCHVAYAPFSRHAHRTLPHCWGLGAPAN